MNPTTYYGESNPSLGERADFLDWLRVIAIGFLLLFHTGMLFVGWGWHIENAETADVLMMPMDIAHRLRMPLLFVIAGASIWFALGRRSAGYVAKERTLRLFLPLVAGMFLIVPPQVFTERVFRDQWHGGYLDFITEKVLQFQPYPVGDFSWHHLWFIAYLFVYSLLLLPLFQWLRHSERGQQWRQQLKPGPWLYALGLPLGLNEAILKPLFPESHDLINDWYIFNHYALLFCYGVLLCWLPGAWDWLMQKRRQLLAVGIAIVVSVLSLETVGILHDNTVGDAIAANLFTWTWLMVFFGYGKRWLSFSNPALRYLREATYPVYILHQTVTVVIGYFIIQLPWGWGAKYLLVLAGTAVISLGLYELIIKRWALTRLLFGLKAKPAVAATLPVVAATSS